jgi:hypothetical protein
MGRVEVGSAGYDILVWRTPHILYKIKCLYPDRHSWAVDVEFGSDRPELEACRDGYPQRLVSVAVASTVALLSGDRDMATESVSAILRSYGWDRFKMAYGKTLNGFTS